MLNIYGSIHHKSQNLNFYEKCGIIIGTVIISRKGEKVMKMTKEFLRNALIATELMIGIIAYLCVAQKIGNERVRSLIIEAQAAEEQQGTLVEMMELPVEMIVVPEVQEEPEEEATNNEWKNIGEFKITAYCGCSACNGIWTGQPTATGTPLVEGRTVAVDPSVIPLGSTIMIDGHPYVAEDTGSAVVGNHIDLFMASHEATDSWGVRYREVYLYTGV